MERSGQTVSVWCLSKRAQKHEHPSQIATSRGQSGLQGEKAPKGAKRHLDGHRRKIGSMDDRGESLIPTDPSEITGKLHHKKGHSPILTGTSGR